MRLKDLLCRFYARIAGLYSYTNTAIKSFAGSEPRKDFVIRGFASYIGKIPVLFLLIFISYFSLAQKYNSPLANDLKKKAEKLFNDEKYDEAIQKYSQLLSLDPQSPLYNYRYGVCMLFAGKDKTQASGYLEAAAKSPTIKPEVHFYLGRSYMYGGHYNEAIAQFEEYKKSGERSPKLNAAQLVGNCKNALELNRERKKISITSQQEANRNTFYVNYDFSEASGKIIRTSDNFLTPKDKSKIEFPVMFITNDGQTAYYASYGKKGDKGKDIYKVVKITGDRWSEPASLGDNINSDEDEDYPYLDKDGKTLYFSSKGHNSIGGYDIFKSVYDFARDEWSVPVNVGIPINTADDDLFYVPNLKTNTATYATAIESEVAKVQIRTISFGDAKSDVVAIKGIYVSQDQAMRHDARISVVNGSNNGVVSSVRTNPRTGEYELLLPPGEDYMLIVEGGSYLPHAESFNLPPAAPGQTLKQKVMMLASTNSSASGNNNSRTEKMTLSNYFNTPLANNSMNKSQSSNTNEAPTEVKTSEVNVASIDSSKLKSITIDGKVIYVAPPTNTASDKSIAINDLNPDKKEHEENQKRQPDYNSNITHQVANRTNHSDTSSTQPLLARNKLKDGNTVLESGDKIKPENEPSTNGQPQDLASEKNSTDEIKQDTVETLNSQIGEAQQDNKTENETAPSKPDITAKTSNAELVKMSFTEAYSLRAEAVTEKEQAKDKRDEGNRLDSISKNQTRQAEQLLSTNKDLAKQLFSEAKESSSQSETKMNEAAALETTAADKEKQADESIKEATQLMTELKVDTHNVAYHSIPKGKQNKSTSRNQQLTSGKGGTTKDSNQPTVALNEKSLPADNATIHPEEKDPALNALQTPSKNNKESNKNSPPTETSTAEANQNSDSTAKPELQAQSKESSALSNTNKPAENNEVALTEKEDHVLENSPGSERHSGVSSQKDSATFQTALNSTKNKEPDNSATAFDNNSVASNSSPSSAGNNSITSKNNSTDPGNNSTTSDNSSSISTISSPSSSSIIISKNEVAPEAKAHYKTYTEKINQSNVTDKEADETDKKMSAAHNAKDRDSLTTKANDLRRLSIAQWQEAQKELAQAKESDPDIEEKIGATASSTHSSSENKKEKNVNTTDNGSTAMNSQSSNSESPNLNSPETPPVLDHADGSKSETKNSPLTTSKNSDANQSTEHTAIGASKDSSRNEVLDTTREEYPKYKEVLKQIDTKQTETVNIFIEGMQINKKAITAREEEMKLRDKAQVETNAKKKSQLLARADSVKIVGDSLSSLSIEKLASAQQNTRAVKDLTTQSDELKSKLIVKQSAAQKPLSDSQAKTQNNRKNELASATTKKNAERINKSENKNIASNEKQAIPVNSNQPVANGTVASEKSSGEISESAAGNNKASNNNGAETEKDNTISTASSATLSETDSTNSSRAVEKNNSASIKSTDAKQSTAPSIQDNEPALTKNETPSELNHQQQTNKQAISKDNATPANNKLASADIPAGKTSSSSESLSKIDFKKNKPPVKPLEGSPIAEAASAVTNVMPARYIPTETETFSLSKTKPYNESNHIPMDVQLPDGLVFKVQVGAFQKPLPDSAFGGLQPLTGETSKPGWIRYCLGSFRSFEPANLLKKDVQGRGYRDAFVVAYLNGKRIPLYEAYQAMSKASPQEKKLYASITNKEIKHLASYDIRSSKFADQPDEDSKAFYGTTETVPADLVEYAVQVGAYKTERVPTAITKMLPLLVEKTPAGLYRFTTGRFTNYASADSMKKIAVEEGVKDAFIVIYKGGNKIAAKDEKAMLRKGRTETALSVTSETSSVPNRMSPDTISPSEIIFRVQLGAYRENVPLNMVSSFLVLSDKGITQETDARGYHIFYIGRYKSYAEAMSTKNEVTAKGIKDAFVAAFANDKRIAVKDALRLLNAK